MFEKIRLKFYSYWLSRKKPKVEGFVNPYPSRVKIPATTSKLNPYVTDYDTKKPKTWQELIFKKKQDTGPLVLVRHGPAPVVVEEIVVPPVVSGPTFFDDMKRVVAGDLTYVATKCRGLVPKPKERRMTENEIKRACENLRW